MDQVLEHFVDKARLVLATVCILLSGLFSLASGSRRSTSNRLSGLMGEKLVSLQPLRSAMQAKARSQFAAGLITIAGLLLMQSILLPVSYSFTLATGLLIGILALSLITISF